MSLTITLKNISMKKIIYTVLILISFVCFGQDSLKVSSCGKDLKTFYLNMDVLHKWQSGQHVNWLTGEPDDPNAVSGIRTHCSAFVAAACERRGIYILRPPEHRQELLANAQFKWLNSEQASDFGWHRINKNILYEAQQRANEGYVVVVCAQNQDVHKPGHIALVMPSDLSKEQIHENGPVLIQSSTKNSVDGLFRNSFRHHIINWDSSTDEVVFYYNDKKACIDN